MNRILKNSLHYMKINTLKFKSITSVLILFLSLSTLANSSTVLKVITHSKGVNLTSGILKTELTVDDTLVIPDNGYVAVLNLNGQKKEIKQKGKFAVSSIVKEFTKEETSFALEYYDFIFNSLSDVSNNKEYTTTAAVHRDMKFTSDQITILTPKKFTVVKGIPLSIKWGHIGDKNTKYTVTLKDTYGKVILKENIIKDSYLFDFNSYIKDDKLTYLLTISLTGNPAVKSNTVSFTVKPDLESQALSSSYKKQLMNLNINSALDNFLLASFFDQNGMGIYALSCMAKAADIESGVATYATAYNSYLETTLTNSK